MNGMKILRATLSIINMAAITLAVGGCTNDGLNAPTYAPGDSKAHAAAKAFTCNKAPAAPRDLHFESMYRKDSVNASIVDPQAYAAYKADTKLISNYEAHLAAMANHYFASRGTQPAPAQCVQEWLYNWATAGALNGDVNRMGELVRKWVLASLSSAWLQVKREKSLDGRKTAAIQKWLRQIAKNVQRDFPLNDPVKSRNNNHLYWAAWGVMVTGVALDQRDLYDWGLRRGFQGVRDIGKDGTLALEIYRGRKALNYHSYSAIPLFMMAEAAAMNGTDLYQENDKALFRLARRIIEGAKNPAYFERKTGEKQDITRTFSAANLVWLEPYYKRTRDPEALALLKRFRPMRHSRVGGDLTMIYRLRDQ